MRRTFALAGLVSALALAGAASAADITLYTQSDLSGRAMTIEGQARDLTSSWIANNASSVTVRGGRFEVCSGPDFSGDCRIINRGDYPSLADPFYHRVGSVREVEPVASVERVYRYETVPAYTYEERGRYGALEVFTQPGFRGDTMKFDRDGRTLDTAVTDQGVGSLVIREGVWELCTGVHFEGNCRVFEPGRYASLDRFDGAPVGSLRRVG